MSAERLGRAPQGSVDDLFPPVVGGRYDDPIEFDDLSYITRPIVEYMHEHPPAAVIAADRDGRLPAFGVWQGWKRRYPGERFPTLDHSIQFARITSRSARYKSVEMVTHHALARAGIERNWGQGHRGQSDAVPPSVMLIDDWPVNGGVAERFATALNNYGLPDEAVTYVSLCGEDIADRNKLVAGVTHVRGDPDRNPKLSAWYDQSHYSGVWYGDLFDGGLHSAVIPQRFQSPSAQLCRSMIIEDMDRYYANYTAALAAGRAAMEPVTEVA